jgi:hypothetical protein
LKKVLILLSSLLPFVLLLSCGYTAPSGGGQTSGLKYRAFFTNSVSSSTGVAGVYIVDAIKDVRATTSPISAGNTPGMMVLTPNRSQTIVFSGIGTQFSDNQFTLINNTTEAAAATGHFTGNTESIVVSPDSSTAYAAVPTTPVVGQSPGVVEVVSLGAGNISAQISCPPINPNPPNPPPPPVCVTAGVGDQGINPPYRYLAIGNTGTRVLGFSQGDDAVANMIAVITPTSVGTANPVITFVPGFDHPVWAFFNSDDTTAYVLNCGAECGGIQASIQTLDLTTNTAGPVVPMCVGAGASQQCAGTAALVVGSTLYVAGTPYSGGSPSQLCAPAQTTLATNCGLLFTFDLPTMTVTNSVVITDGYHTRLSMGANGQLLVGARTCTEIIPPLPIQPGAEIRGCLSIYNTLPTTTVGTNPPGGVLIPPANGDVTGLQPIATRMVSYVVQGGSVGIYDMTTDAINETEQQKLSNLVGVFIDVKTVDF